MEGIFLLLGSNLGNRVEVMAKARESLENKGIEILQSSAIYETEAWGKTDQQKFLNQVLHVSTDLTAHDLLKIALDTENNMGRVRKEKWGERLIDIDILYYNQETYQSKNLEIPHPGIPFRRFTLVPLVELNSDFVHPVFKRTQLELLNSCEDHLEVSIFSKF